MIKLDVLRSEDLQGTIKKFISALLPTEVFEPKFFGTILQTLFKYVHLDEFEMEYYLLLKALSEYGKIASNFPDYVPKLDATEFDSLVEKSIAEAITRPELGVKEWREWEGFNSNLDNEIVREECCQLVCQRCSDLYEECFSLAVPSAEVLGAEVELAEVFKQEASLQLINTQAAILRGSERIGRKLYSGAEDSLKYCEIAITEIRNRTTTGQQSNVITLDSLERVNYVLNETKIIFDKIADWGIPPLDKGTPILRHRLVVVVGDEGTGKTHFAIDKAVNVVLAGKKVLYMCGETKPGKIYYLLLKNYIWKKFGVIVRSEDILYPDDCPPDIAKVIKIAILETVNGGSFSFAEAFSYNTLDSEMQAKYDENKFDLVVIDHSMALKGTVGDGSMHTKVSTLSEACLSFKNRNPVCVLVCSHTSTASKTLLAKGESPTNSTTKGSNDLSADADEVFTLSPNPSLDKQGLIKFINSKRRDFSRLVDPILLRKMFEVSAFIYDRDYLVSNDDLTIDQQEAISALDSDFNEQDFPF